MPKVGNRGKPKLPKPKCVACGDTGKNSKGGPCRPCEDNGRLKK